MNKIWISAVISSINMVLVFSPVFSLLSGVSPVLPRPLIFLEVLGVVLFSAFISIKGNASLLHKVAWPFFASIIVWGSVAIAWDIPRFFFFVEFVRVDVQRIVLFAFPGLLAMEYFFLRPDFPASRQVGISNQKGELVMLNGLVIACMTLGVVIYFGKTFFSINAFYGGFRMLVLFMSLVFPSYLLGLGAFRGPVTGGGGLFHNFRNVLYLIGVCGLCLFMVSL